MGVLIALGFTAFAAVQDGRMIGASFDPSKRNSATASARPELHTLKLTNWSLTAVAPPGIVAQVPMYAFKKPLEGLDKLVPTGTTSRDYNFPTELHTTGGGRIFYSLATFSDEDRKGLPASIKEWETSPHFFVQQPWIGTLEVGANGTLISVATQKSMLIIKASWPRGDEKAKDEVDATIKWFLETVAIDPTAKVFDIFPRTAEEPYVPVPKGTEVAMKDGMRVTATTPIGKIAVTAGPGLKRTYTWEGASRSVIMEARRKPWYGSLGLYYPGPGNHWEEHRGITRGVLEEGQQHFKSEAEALKWLKGRSYIPYVYTSDGLVVGWMKVLDRNQLNVEVWQILINGKKPKALPGAQNAKIKVDRVSVGKLK